MLEFMRGQASDRKMRMFACACCQRVWELIPDEGSRGKVLAAEQFADGRLREDEFTAIQNQADEEAAGDTDYHTWIGNVTAHIQEQSAREAAPAAVSAAWLTLQGSSHSVQTVAIWAVRAFVVAQQPESAFCNNYRQAPHWDRKMELLEAANPVAKQLAASELRHQASFALDIFGNPFRAVAISPSIMAWNSGTIPKLAQVIYAERRFADLPLLADALEEAGCDNADILAHCRAGGEHVRGCWVLDLVRAVD
jgi:hypothetical protein